MITPAGMKRVPINPPRGHDPKTHQQVGEVHSWDAPHEKLHAKMRDILEITQEKERLESAPPD